MLELDLFEDAIGQNLRYLVRKWHVRVGGEELFDLLQASKGNLLLEAIEGALTEPKGQKLIPDGIHARRKEVVLRPL